MERRESGASSAGVSGSCHGIRGVRHNGWQELLANGMVEPAVGAALEGGLTRSPAAGCRLLKESSRPHRLRSILSSPA
jgi:hypothetical protein